MNLFGSLGGQVTVEVVSADIPGVLTALGNAGIPICDTELIDSLTARLVVDRHQYNNVRCLLSKRGDAFRLFRRSGVFWALKGLIRRPVLMVGLAGLLLLSAFLPTKVLFVQVEGNAAISSKLIVECAEDCGIGFGASRREVRSERVKNSLLEKLPGLQWVGVNTYGCVAVIRVRERSQPQRLNTDHRVSSIVAARDGVIQSVHVNRGTVLCAKGQAVEKGQILISGYTDCGFSIKAQQAEGEIMALTSRQLSAVTPEIVWLRGKKQASEQKISLIVGKFRINFFKDSGILDTTCVKMYSENYITLPGGFRLPVAVGVYRLVQYGCEQHSTPNPESTLSAFVQRYLPGQMLAGQIMHSQENIHGCRLEGRYDCLEMIGRICYEESILENENR